MTSAGSGAATVWHVTRLENLASILAEGLVPGWGDAGLGVYVWGDLAAAEDYLLGGGWDGEAAPADLAILEITCAAEDLEFILPDPSWPNPEDYDQVRMWPAVDENQVWRPVIRVLEEDAPAPAEEDEGPAP